MLNHFHALDIPYHFYETLPMPRLIQYSYTPTFTVHFPADKIGALLHKCLNIGASKTESKSKLCGYLHNILYFSTMYLRLTITNLLLWSPFSSFNLENQTVEFTIQFSLECSTSLYASIRSLSYLGHSISFHFLVKVSMLTSKTLIPYSISC